MRGALTPRITAKASELLGMKITLRELRLIPYVQYVMVNEQKIDPRHVSQEERAILKTWSERGWIEVGAGGLSVSKKFWDAMGEILWLGYVDYRNAS